MKLVCHIGTPKTASTHIQNTCAANAGWLAERGVAWPDLMSPDANHITLFYASSEHLHDFARGYGLKTREDAERFRETMDRTIAARVAEADPGIHTMLMSSENLSANMRLPGIARLKSLLEPHFDEIRILVYLRRQDEAALSMYAEYMRKGFSGAPFEAFMDKVLTPPGPTPYLYYRRLLMEWAEVFGREAITVRLFERSQLRSGDPLSDFMAELLGEDADLAGLAPGTSANASLSAPALEFLRRIQPAVPYIKDGVTNPRRRALEPAIETLPTAPRPRMSAAESARIMAQFAPVNAWVRDHWFAGHKGPLFTPARDLPQTGNLGRIGLDAFAEFTGKMLQ